MLVMDPSPPRGSLLLCKGWTDMHPEKPASLLVLLDQPCQANLPAHAERATVGKITSLADEQHL